MGDNDASASLDILIRQRAEGTAIADTHKALDTAAEKADKLTESTHSLQGEQEGSIRTTHHFTESLIGLAEGGDRVLPALATDARIVGEVFEESFGVAAPWIIGISTFLAFGMPQLQKALGEAGDKAAGAKEKSEELVAALAKVKDVTDNMTFERYGFFLSDLIKGTDQLNQQAAALKLIQHAQDELHSANLALAINKLDDQQERESEGKDPNARAAIARKYDRERLALRAGFDEEKGKQDVTRAEQEKQRAQAEFDANRRELSVNDADTFSQAAEFDKARQGVPGLKSDVEVTKDRIAELEAKWDAQGGTVDLNPAAQRQYAQEKIEHSQLQALLPQQEARQGNSQFPVYQSQLEALTDEHAKAKDDLQKATKKKDANAALQAQQVLVSTGNQIDAINEYQTRIKDLAKQAGDTIQSRKKLNEAQTDLAAKLTAAADALEAAKVNAQASQIKQSTEAAKLAQTQTQQIGQEDAQATIDRLKRQVIELQTQLKNPALNDLQRAALQQEIAQKEASQKERELVYQQQYGLVTPTQADIFGAQVRDQVQGAQYDRSKADAKAGVPPVPTDPDPQGTNEFINNTLSQLDDGKAAHEALRTAVMKLPDAASRLAKLSEGTADSLDKLYQYIEAQLARQDQRNAQFDARLRNGNTH